MRYATDNGGTHAGLMWLIGVFWAFYAATAGAQTFPDAANVTLDLAHRMEVLVDVDGELTIEEVTAEPVASRFQRNKQPVFNAGFSSAPYWFRVSLPPLSDITPGILRWYLELAWPLLDEVDFYLPDGRGGWDCIRSGDSLPFSSRVVAHRNFVQPITLHPSEPQTVYLRIRTGGSLEVPLYLVSAESLWLRNDAELLVRGSYYGLMLGMLLYNLLVFVSLREPLYFKYNMSILFSGLLTPLSLDGLGAQYLWGDYPYWTNVSTPFSLAVTLFWAASYTVEYLQMKLRAPRAYRCMQIFIAVTCLGAVLAFIVPYAVGIRFSIALATAGAILIQLIVLQMMWSRERLAILYGLAFTPLLLSAVTKTLHAMGMLPSNIFTENALQFGMGFMVIAFSLLLSDKINQEREEKLRVSRLKRFFSPAVATAITAEGGEELLAPTRRYVVVLFADLRGFTGFAAQTNPGEVLRVLREYHQVCTETASRHNGTLEHFVGDGVMICFNAPVQIDQPEQRAVDLALDLRHQFEALMQDWKARGHLLGVGMGMAAGEATVGVVGQADRLDYTTIGTVANLASRLCGMASHGQILLPESFIEQLSAPVNIEKLGERSVKGILEPVSVCVLRDTVDETITAKPHS